MLITFEGIDGCGKSTQIDLLTERLKREKIEYHLFREPGGTEVSEEVRKLLLHSRAPMDPVTELLLFSAARSQLIAEKVRPLIEKGNVVILDRFYDSTIAYQGYGRQSASPEQISRLNTLASHGLVPDCTIYLRVSPEVGRQRRDGMKQDRMEREKMEFFERVAEGFEQLAREEARIVVIDGTLSPDQVHLQIVKHLEPHLFV